MAYRHAPAMVNRTLSRYYDLFVNAICVGIRLQKRTLGYMELHIDDNYLDVGCGTGTLAILVKERYGKVNVRAVDPDSTVIDVAKQKASKRGVDIEFIRSAAESLPMEDQSQHLVTSSLALHHMPTEIKIAALSEIKRVLKKDGTFILVDIGRPRNGLWKLLCGMEALVEPREYIKDNLDGKIPGMLTSCGFTILTTYEPYMGIYTWRCKVTV